MREWSEIRCDYIDIDGFWRVDAWKTDSDEEQGEVIAYIDDWSGRVIYANPIARVDDYAQEVITGKVAEVVNNRIYISKGLNNYTSIKVKTIAGDLEMQLEPVEYNGDDRMYIGLYLPEYKEYIDLVGVKVEEDKSCGYEIKVLVNSDLSSEDPAEVIYIDHNDIIATFDSLNE